MYFYPNFTRLCAKKGVSPTFATQQVGLSNAAANKWKKNFEAGNENLRYITLQKLADFFGVPVAELTKEPEEPKDSEKLTAEESALVQAWRRATEEQKENVAFILRNTRKEV